MRNFLIGYGAGLITYHYISGGFKHDDLVAEMRSMIKKVDDRLAEAEKPSTADPDESPFKPPETSETSETL
jgi:hypothetical protein